MSANDLLGAPASSPPSSPINVLTGKEAGAPQETFVLNLGPQHPATHGVLRVKLTMDGEYVVRAEPVCGYIHRMQEKMGENRTYAQFLPNTSRIDYLSAMTYTHAFVGAVERAAKIQPPPRAEYIRVITSELNRISSHLVWWGAFLLDLGGFTPLLYAFDDREKILDLLEAITGARLTYCYYRFGGLYNDVDDAFVTGTREFVKHMRPRLKMYRDLVTGNIILRKRLEDIGPISPEMCRKYGASGPVIRGSGIGYDVRRAEPYSVYPELDFEIPTFNECDSMARYLVRMEEIAQSLRIIEQALDKLPAGPVMAEKVPRVLKLPAGDYCYAVEAARGRFMVRLVSDNKEIPYRVKLRTPCLSNLSLFEEASRGMLLPDALALMGSLDLVIPDIDLMNILAKIVTFFSTDPGRLLLALGAIMAFVGFNAAYLVWVERKGAGRFQRRPGPNEVGPAGLLQPLVDALKLMSKQLILPTGVDSILFRVAPLLMMSPVLMSLAVIPWSEHLAARSINVGLLMIFAFGAINVMAIMLGGWASRNKYAIISAARVVSQNVAYEIPMLLVVITMILVTGTMNLNEIVAQQHGGFWHWNLLRVWVNPLMPVTFLIFYTCMLAETNRAPFDMAEAESELVAGAYTEYSGMGFGVFFMAEYANILLGCSLATVLFLGGWQSPLAFLPTLGPLWFLLKMYFLVFSVVWVRWTFPRTQFYGLLNLSWKILIPVSLVTLVLSSAMMKLL